MLIARYKMLLSHGKLYAVEIWNILDFQHNKNYIVYQGYLVDFYASHRNLLWKSDLSIAYVALKSNLEMCKSENPIITETVRCKSGMHFQLLECVQMVEMNGSQ
jgi:hypothetical protein